MALNPIYMLLTPQFLSLARIPLLTLKLYIHLPDYPTSLPEGLTCISQTEFLKSPPKFASLAVLPILLNDNSSLLFTLAKILEVIFYMPQ